MYRLIYKEADGDLTCRSRDFDKVFPTLYAYEETGLTPDQVKTLSDKLDAIQKEDGIKDLQLHLMADERNIALKERDALAAELKEEMYRHDRYVDFELAESEELRKAKEELNATKKERDRLAELWAQVPATIETQVIRKCEGEFSEDNNVPGKEEA